MSALYELASEYRTALAVLESSDLDEQTIVDTLEGLQFPVEEKAKQVALFIRNRETLAQSMKEAEASIATRRKAIETQVASMERYLKANMETCGITKIESPWLVLSIAKNPPKVEIDAESLIPAEFWKQPAPPPPTVDKVSLAAALKSGQDVPGAHLSQSTRLVIK